ncbi:MAG: tripartite tricarboxylate transporter TctB family protein [Rhodobacter sp.]|nr:tripartite tricarboxylate transporter TctB family protein [Paracoccaceae bacterium]MCC0076261.1 tripartite tricarboxylate transporter TctB family protein [Rhodobacter sp.]
MRRLFEVRDIVVPLVAVGLAALLALGAAQLPPARFEPMGPAGLPYGVALALLMLSVLDVVSTLLKRRRSRAVPVAAPQSAPHAVGRTLLGLAVIVAYLLILQSGWVGFVTASAVFLTLLGAVLSNRLRGEIFVLVAVAFAVSMGTGLLLTRVLVVVLPGNGALF